MENEQQGFATLAVGHTRYYQMALNLLKSYKLHNPNPLPWVIYVDRENEYTKFFDRVVILENPHLSYLDKLECIKRPVFNKTLFIDADCLIYRDINDLFRLFEKGISFYGTKYPLDEEEKGWFKLKDVGEYKDRVKFIPNFHGGIFFYANDYLTTQIITDAENIAQNYHNYKFKYFELPADEPILALSLSCNNGLLIEDKNAAEETFLFYPAAKKVRCNIKKGDLSYIDKQNRHIKNIKICHWQNYNTKRACYKNEILRLSQSNFTKFRTTSNTLIQFINDTILNTKILVSKLLK